MNKERKLQIIQTAAQAFREKGYTAVTMRDLAEEMGIKAASLYNHIQSKEGILSDIVMELTDEFSNHMDRLMAEEKSVVEKINEIIAMHVSTTIRKTDYLACMNKEWRNLGEETQEVYLSKRRKYEEQFLQLIKKGIEVGELQNRNPEILLFSILSTLRTLYHWYSAQENITEKELVDNLQKNLLYGLVK